MKKIVIGTVLLLLALFLLAGCHHTGRQFRKMFDGMHDLVLEGSG